MQHVYTKSTFHPRLDRCAPERPKTLTIAESKGQHTKLLTSDRRFGSLRSWHDWHELLHLVCRITSLSMETADSRRSSAMKITRPTWS